MRVREDGVTYGTRRGFGPSRSTAPSASARTHYAEAVTVDDQLRPVADLTRLSLVEPDAQAQLD